MGEEQETLKGASARVAPTEASVSDKETKATSSSFTTIFMSNPEEEVKTVDSIQPTKAIRGYPGITPVGGSITTSLPVTGTSPVTAANTTHWQSISLPEMPSAKETLLSQVTIS